MSERFKEICIVFPTQLFSNHPAISKNRDIYLLEHSRYFTDFTFHKQKLIFHRASMKAYEKELRSRNYRIHYITFDNTKSFFESLQAKNIGAIHYVDPVDHEITRSMNKIMKSLKIKQKIYESPAFLSPERWLKSIFSKEKKYHMSSFYQLQRKRLNILMNGGKPVGGKWSFDAANREPLPANIKIPSIKKIRQSAGILEAKKYVKAHFANNPGHIDTFIYPVTHVEAKKWLDHFLKNQLATFGVYQDAIVNDELFLFHSVLSPLLNVGLITPDYVVAKTLAYAKKNRVPLNSLEGFIRQIIGWREFVRAVYITEGDKYHRENFFKHTRSIPQSWWYGKTGILPIDDSIHKALGYAYVHHIERLMVLGNFMLLCEFKPAEVYEWFMEFFIDAYDWVMVPNVFGMSQYADGGLITTKPYISGSNYILNMSNYKKGPWCALWTALYWRFLYKHKAVLSKNVRMKLALTALKNMKPEELKKHVTLANTYLDSL